MSISQNRMIARNILVIDPDLGNYQGKLCMTGGY